MRPFLFCTAALLLPQLANAQLDSILDQGVYRTFIAHLPAGYDPNVHYPLVMDLHGLNSNGAQQELYSAFDPIADTAGFIIAYPNAINGSWNLTGSAPQDVTFLGDLVDTLRDRYSTNGCLFYTGMSDGAFMSYKMACESPQPLAAVAIVAGNMTSLLQAGCPVAAGLPIMHFHGTADPLVSYDGTFGIPPVETTIQYWVNKNGCDPTPQMTALPNTVPEDSCTVVRFTYSGGVDGSDVIFYRIDNGGHTWPGALPIPAFGPTNEDISASALIWGFFRAHCGSSTSIRPLQRTPPAVFPDPATDHVHVEIPIGAGPCVAELCDANGRFQRSFPVHGATELDLGGLAPGTYFIRFTGHAYEAVARLAVMAP